MVSARPALATGDKDAGELVSVCQLLCGPTRKQLLMQADAQTHQLWAFRKPTFAVDIYKVHCKC